MQIVKWITLSVIVGLIAANGVIADLHKDGDKMKPKAEIGKAAPEFTLKGIDGKEYKLADHNDKIVVLEWFNKNCPFVVGASKFMSETQAKYAKQGVVWMAIDSTSDKHRDFETPEAIAKYAKENNLDYPILKDAGGDVGRMYGAKTTPHIFIINKGELVYIGGHSNVQGAKPGDRNYIAEALDALVNGKPVPSPTTPNRGCSVKYKG